MVTIEEGKYYRFKIAGTVKGVDGEYFFKLSDPNGVNHLLKRKWYEQYNLNEGDSVICHIDKINCNGRIFIEPEHPVYKRNGIYDFEVTDFVEDKNGNLFIVKDVFGNSVEIPETGRQKELKPGDIVKCRVITVKKGRPVLIPVDAEPDYSGFEDGEEYVFEITGVKRFSGRYTFFIMTDTDGNEYPLRKKFYEEYGIKTGDKIKCKFIVSGAESYFEPEHPFYKKGKEYEFFIIGEDYIHKYPDGKEKAVVLLNDYGKEILVSRKNIDQGKLESNIIRCRVKDIVKGQLILDC